MPRRPVDDVAARSGSLTSRFLVLAGGFALAVAATLAVFLTDNPQHLRIAVVAVAWAFVLATFAAGRRSGDRAEAAVRESELRRAYELELEREVAARREYELELENDMRRETEGSMRDELDALRGDIAGLSGLREEIARVSALRGDISALTDLRDQVARVAALRDDIAALGALRDDVAALTTLRGELGQLAELRADMGRLRVELAEQLSSEMLIERIVMRTQASRLPGEAGRGEAGRALEGTASWTDDVPPRELTGGWPAVRLDEPRETQQFEQVRIERSASRPPVQAPEPALSWQAPEWEPTAAESRWEAPSIPWDAPRTGWTSAPLPPLPAPPAPGTAEFPAPPPAAPTPSSTLSGPLPSPLSADRWSPSPEPDLAPRRSRHSVAEPASAPVAPPTAAFPMSPPVPSEPPPSPLDWLASRSLLDPPSASAAAPPAPSTASSLPAPPAARPEVPPRRRRSDEPTAVAVPNEFAPTTQHPAVSGRPSPTPRSEPSATPPARPEFDRSAFRFAVREDAPAAEAPNNDAARILAENGAAPATGSRRRRRYRDDGEADDVLARVLRGE